MSESIRSFDGEFRFLSNFGQGEIRDRTGMVWKTSEHAYQAMKFDDPAMRERIRNAATPGEAKKLGRAKGMRRDWNDIRLTVMLRIVRAKFTQNEELGRKLLATGERELIEGNTWGDRFWGVCDGVGENHLGKILMRVREELKQKS